MIKSESDSEFDDGSLSNKIVILINGDFTYLGFYQAQRSCLFGINFLFRNKNQGTIQRTVMERKNLNYADAEQSALEIRTDFFFFSSWKS